MACVNTEHISEHDVGLDACRKNAKVMNVLILLLSTRRYGKTPNITFQ